MKELRRRQGAGVHRTEFLCAGAYRRIFPHSAQCADPICLGKGTYARCGIIVNVTPLEPEWEGHVTLEFSNTTTLCRQRSMPTKVWRRCCSSEVGRSLREVSYSRGGKYQGQTGVTLPKTYRFASRTSRSVAGFFCGG